MSGRTESFNAIYNPLSNPTSFEWILNPMRGNYVYPGVDGVTISFFSTGTYQLVVRASNSKGTSQYYVGGLEVYDASKMNKYKIYPNPTSDNLTIDVNSELLEVMNSSMSLNKVIKSYEISLYSNNGVLKKKNVINNFPMILNVSDLQNGIYYLYVETSTSEKPEVYKVVISH